MDEEAEERLRKRGKGPNRFAGCISSASALELADFGVNLPALVCEALPYATKCVKCLVG